MPRICPMQLLNCLSVLLSPHGGIKSRDEVQRLASLMTKFSKKLVSKCIYIQILKCTETDLLGLFMGSGGWRLVHMWLTESIVAKNWPLVRELLELLLLCPVDIERLKTNNCPKLVKELSKDGNHYAIRALASKLVEQWLKTVKGEQVVPIKLSDISHIVLDAQTEIEPEIKNENPSDVESEIKENDSNTESIVKVENPSDELPNQEEKENNIKITDTEKEAETLPVLKITLKNGKQILSQVDDSDSKASDDLPEKEKIKEKHKSKSREKSNDKHSYSSKSSSSKHSSKSSSEKHRSSHKSSSSKHSSKDKTKDKDKHSSHSSKSKHNTSNSSISSNSSSSKRSSSSSSKTRDDKSKVSSDKEKSKEKDEKGKESPKPSDEKAEEKQNPTPPSIQKLGKIPKLSDVKKEKPSISIEVRKPDEPKPKTVKTFHSKFRKHGLEEEVKPPPSRASILNKKPPPVLPPTIPIPKRPSPVHNEPPPEKKLKTIDIIEKPGAIKLIPPKPKPMLLLESDMFMDALNASATNKKEPKKRKRRISGSKDGNAPNETSPPATPTNITSPNSENKSVPPRFYQDTLDTEENKQNVSEKTSVSSEVTENDKDPENEEQEKIEMSEPHTVTVNGLRGVLCYHKRKGPKKSIKWKPDSELEEIQYFELDETERVNVTKTFTDMKHLERIHEREAFQKARNLSNDDVMEEKTSWKPLIPIDLDGQIQVEYGKNSKEKDIQAIRQKGTLQPLYFHKSMIPDSPLEPEPETHPYSEPTVIPLDDVTGNQDNISDFRNMPWPEPKGNAPPTSNSNMNVPSIFPPTMAQFPTSFPGPPQFPGGPPGFPGSPMVPGEWQNGVPPHMMPNGIPGPMPGPGLTPPGPIPPNNMPPGIMVPPENMMMSPDMFGPPNPMFPVPPEGFNMQQNMFPMDFNMPGPQGPQGPPGPEGFSGPGNFRGAMRGRGAGGHWRDIYYLKKLKDLKERLLKKDYSTVIEYK
ncbi:unnamed protein product [Parnassius apollo]|uniref:(apollo) hypothetical protein n=1 Tax=Parnassius apollo TaxID=110799 RepID=A0A8S3XET7_PARAO|nr:unnamed protein product [Parnassius apollo]